MLLWSYLGTVQDIVGPASFTAELDLGCKWYHPALIQVAGIRPRSTDKLRQALPEGTRFVALAEQISGDQPIRAHVMLADGADLAAVLSGKPVKPAPAATYGSGFGKVWRYPATVLRVTDGDTLLTRTQMGVPTCYTNSVRVRHINSAEKHTASGDAATAYADRLIAPGAQVTVVSHELERYGRILGDVVMADGRDYGSLMLAAGHAVPYEGGAR